MSWDYLDLADYLLIAEAVLDIPAADIAKAVRLELAESALHAPAAEFGGVEFYEDLPSKAAVLCSRLVRNHPLPDGNKRAGYISMLEFIARNGGQWTYPPNDPEGDETVDIIERLAAGDLSEDELEAWIRERLGSQAS